MKHQNKNFLMGLLAAMSFININAFAQWTGTNPIWTNSNVGIGTSTPWYLLSLYKDQNAITGVSIDNYNQGTSAGAEFLAQTFGALAQVRVGVNGRNTLSGLAPKIAAGYLYSKNDFYLTTDLGNINFVANQSIIFVPGGTNEFVRITPWKTFGIGTSTPIQTLDVNGRINVTQGVIQKGGAAITNTTDMGLYSLTPGTWMRFVTNGGPIRFFADGGTNTTGGTSLFNIEANGFIGIGTNTPSQKLEIAGNAKLSGTLLGTSFNQTMVATGDLNWSFGGYQSGNNFWMQATYWDTGDNLRGFRILNKGTNDVVFSTNKQNTFIPFGNVGIGTTDTKGYKLAVNGSVVATSVTVKTYATWPDFVFTKEHKLLTISEVEKYINEHKHLPNIPSATEVEKSGINLAQMDAKLLEKIEELTLYILEQNKRIQALESSLKK